MKSERIRRGVKRTKPDVVELLRREVVQLCAYSKQHEECRSNSASYANGRHDGMGSAYEHAAERLQAIIDQLTEASK